jgi:ATP-dependent RNA helicase RhlE
LSFSQLGLAEPLVRAVSAAGYSIPTPIQVQAIPVVITGRDLLGVAQTGTGKTAAFALPILHRLLELAQPIPPAPPSEGREKTRPRRESRDRRKIRVLVLAPTRELAVQIDQSFATYGRGSGLRHAVVFGGVSQFHQVNALQSGIDILIATPGRLMDLREQGYVNLSHVQVLVLDEADRMLDMGFMPVVREVVGLLPSERQTLLFSATMPREIRDLADTILRDPANIEIASVTATADNIEQSVYLIEKPHKPHLLRHLLRRPEVTRALVFTKTKHTADRVARQLQDGNFAADAIHSNRTQAQRQKALANFKSGRAIVLVATDIAARGIDVDSISHVINFDLPLEPENYVHRIGRTARAGASGIALSFCSPDERGRLKAIERLIRQRLPVCDELPQFMMPQQASDAEILRRLPTQDRPVGAKPSRIARNVEPTGSTAKQPFRPRHGQGQFAQEASQQRRGPKRFKRFSKTGRG